jgi:organic hydroperoxide reductase OsmC/OhrA
MTALHRYGASIRWTGDLGRGTSGYREYARDYVISVPGKVDLLGSSDPKFRGDASRHNPEELLVAALSACHMLWYLHLCADAGVVVIAYDDHAEGVMETTSDGSGHFQRVTLHPRVEIAGGTEAVALALHDRAHSMCFVARSMNFPVDHIATVTRSSP